MCKNNLLLRQLRRRRILPVLMAVLVGAIALFTVTATQGATQAATQAMVAQAEASPSLPPLQAHPLPPSLAQWHDPSQPGDYFDEIQPTPAGYLIWSAFPVTVFVEPATHAPGDRSQGWVDAVRGAIAEWEPYLPLAIVDQAEGADIQIWRRNPPLSRDGEMLRARSAEARFEFRLDEQQSPPILTHRFTISLRPGQSAEYLQAAARHELGHALGIWGHSPEPTDALYFSQVSEPALISSRDINTLRRIYEQPTRLGWPLIRQQQ
jgi:predicted Zn-dependent protease